MSEGHISNEHDAYSSKQNVEMQEGHVLSEGSLSNEHSTFSRKSSNKTQNLKQHQETDSIGSESYKANLSLFHESMQYTTIQCSECFEACMACKNQTKMCCLRSFDSKMCSYARSNQNNMPTLVRFPPWPGIFFKPARCGNTLRVTSQASYSPEYTTPSQQIS